MEAKEIGQILHDARIKKGLSLREAAKRIGVTHPAIKKWESGHSPSCVYFIKALQVYNVTNWEQIFNEEYAATKIEDEK